ncbi:hypothetical protein J6590_091545 [Homalodisca vitripennis]|nr:hypothetical protein J6590_091545 [Homalodisca vitripennis]
MIFATQKFRSLTNSRRPGIATSPIFDRHDLKVSEELKDTYQGACPTRGRRKRRDIAVCGIQKQLSNVPSMEKHRLPYGSSTMSLRLHLKQSLQT